MRVPTISILILIALTLAGCGRDKPEAPTASSPTGTTTPRAGAAASAPVEVAVVQQGVLEETISLTGHLRAMSRAQVHSRLSGRVASVTVREGDHVTVGQALVILDSSSLQAQERQALANLQAARARLRQAQTGRGLTDVQSTLEIQRVEQAVFQAEANSARAKAEYADAVHNLKRQQTLFSQNAVSKYSVEQAQLRERVSREQLRVARSAEKAAGKGVNIAQANREQVGMRESEVEAAVAAVAQAQASLETVQVDVGDTVLRSPVSGTVIKRTVEPGQAVNAQTGGPLVIVVDNSTLDMLAPMEESHRTSIHKNASVQITTTVGGVVTGKVIDVIPASDPSTHTVTVRLKVSNIKGSLVEGAYASAQLTLRRVQGVIVDRKALIHKGDQTFLVLAENEKARRTPVKVLLATELQAAVSGVNPGSQVVVAGGENLQNGQALEIRQGGSKS